MTPMATANPTSRSQSDRWKASGREKLAPSSDTTRSLLDSACASCRAGHRSYFIRYRNKHGRSRWFTIGEHGKITAEAARRAAQRILQAVAVDGSDPPGEREAFRAAPTVNDLLDRYIKEHLEQRCRLRTIESFKGVVERDTPRARASEGCRC
jgi:hypothetical protein